MLDASLDGMVLTRCPSCQATYPIDRVREVMRKGQRFVLHATCSSCEDALILSVQKHQGGAACAGLLSDCSYEDAVRFAKAPRITTDQVLDAHMTNWLAGMTRLDILSKS